MKHWKFYAIFVFALAGVLVLVDGLTAFPHGFWQVRTLMGAYLCMMSVAAWADYRELVEKQKNNWFFGWGYVDNMTKPFDIRPWNLLTKPCDACGHKIGWGYKHCPKCDIYLCFMCRFALTRVTNEFPAKCLMCGGKLG